MKTNKQEQQIWTKIEPKYSPGTSSQLDGRAAHTIDLYKQHLLLYGGWNGLHALQDLYLFDLKHHTWKQVVTHGQIYLLGQLPNQRNNHASCLFGHDGVNWLGDLYILQLDNKFIWSKPQVCGKVKKYNQSPEPRACHSMNRINKRIYLFGGYDGQQCYNNLYLLDIEKLLWEQPDINGCKPMARNGHTMSSYEDKLILFGGHSGTIHLNDLYILDTIKLTWSQIQQEGNRPQCMRGHSATVIGSSIYIFGGYKRLNYLYTYNVVTNKWLKNAFDISQSGYFPSPRQRHSAVAFQNNKIILFGGFDGNKWLNDLYYLNTNSVQSKRIKLQVANIYKNRNNIINNITKMLFNKKQFSDIQFHINNQILYAHKAILYSQSQYFRNMLTSQTQTNSCQINNWSYEPFKSMIEFIYSGQVSLLNLQQNQVLQLLAIAEFYMIEGLKQWCQKELVKVLCLQNCCELLIGSHECNAQELKKITLEFIIKNIQQIYGSQKYQKLQKCPHLLIDITRIVLSNVNLKNL